MTTLLVRPAQRRADSATDPRPTDRGAVFASISEGALQREVDGELPVEVSSRLFEVSGTRSADSAGTSPTARRRPTTASPDPAKGSSMKFHWFLPTNGGDGRHVVSGGHGVSHGAGGRPASVPYLGQIARSAEQLGFEAALTPTGAWCEDAWLTTAMLAPLSERLKFLVAFRPGMTSPTLTAQMAATFQNLSGGRLLPYPHLEGAHHFGEGVSPLLVKRGLWTNPVPVAARASVPFGGQRAAS